MSIAGTWRRMGLVAALTGAGLLAVAVHAAVPSTDGKIYETWLTQAQDEACATSGGAPCVSLLNRLDQVADRLTPEQRQRLHYLHAWQAGLVGQYARADALIDGILRESGDVNLRLKSAMLRVDMLKEQRRYAEAFRQLSQQLVQLEAGSGVAPHRREQGMVIASGLYLEAGQFDLASYYAEQIYQQGLVSPGYACVDAYTRIAARYRGDQWQGIEQLMRQGIADCRQERNTLYANGIRYYEARLALRRKQPKQAIALLRSHLPEVQNDGYAPQVVQFDALLALAYWDIEEPELARQSALAAVSQGSRTPAAEAMASAYRILYLVAKQQGLLADALAYHEHYMAADKGYLDEVSAKALAFQTVQQQLVARKLQVDTLSKQNQILQLQQSLDRKASETSRLQILLLLVVVAFIAFWTYRIKRSQLRFMKLARRDGLTGIYNRQHFVGEAERQLLYCRKSSREVCLVLIDLDHFKVVNDTFGHSTGDRVLKHAVAACQTHLRSTDIFGRLGGEEFGILLPECTLEQVVRRVEQLRVAIAAVAEVDALDVAVSASFGVAATEHSGYDLRALLIHADDALYQAKDTGRNRAVVFDATMCGDRQEMRKSRSGMTEMDVEIEVEDYP